MSTYGAVEAGGTKFVLAVGEVPDQPRDILRIETSSDPRETVAAVVSYFQARGPLAAVGVSCFGPLDLATGYITNTPKPGWQHFPLKQELAAALSVDVGIDTDVNGAALGEALYGAGRGLSSFVYITVGTGIGGGAVVGGQPVHGKMHPEMGHLVLRRHPEEPAAFGGVCPVHGDCLEGLASGPAIEARWGSSAAALPAGHPAWDIEAYYLAQACVDLACILSPEAVVLGGGVMSQAHLFPLIRKHMEALCHGYLPLPEVKSPALAWPGLTGALLLAQRART
jgi:fructokinase